MKRTFLRSLIAVIAGNVIYYAVERWLPPVAQHQVFEFDLGLIIDFWCCLFCYGIVRLIK